MNNTSPTSALRLLAVLFAGLMLLSACGSDSDSDASSDDAASTDDGGSSSDGNEYEAFCSSSTAFQSLASPDDLDDDLAQSLKDQAPAEIEADVTLVVDAVLAGDLSGDEVIDASRTIAAFHGDNCM